MADRLQSLDHGASSVFYPFNGDATGSLDASMMTGSFAVFGSEGVLEKWSAAAEMADAERLVSLLRHRACSGDPIASLVAAPTVFYPLLCVV